MNDDSPHFVVPSGSEHRVSVSEYTGDAKTPKNVVVSDPEETRERKLAFDHQHDVSANTDRTVVKDTQQAASVEALAATDTNKPKVLQVPDNGVGANGQTTAATPAVPNVQHVATEVIATNAQALPTEAVKDNLQSVSNNPQISDNRQPVNGPALVEPNLQKVTGEAVAPDNRQSLGQDQQDDTRVLIDTARSEPNRQAVAADDVGINRQALSHAAAMPNRQEIGAEKIADHSEKLSGAEIARSQVQLPSDEQPGIANAPPLRSSPASGPSHAAPAAEETKLKHDQTASAFQRRLLGIKHNVDNLNGRLTDFEQKQP